MVQNTPHITRTALRIIPSHHKSVEATLRYSNPTTRLLVICHGYKSSSEHPALQRISDGLVKKGHSVLTFTFSDDTSGYNVKQQVEDIRAISHKMHQYKEIFLLGGSLGALSAVIATLKIARIKGVVTVNGFFGGTELAGKFRRIFLSFKLLATIHPTYRRIWKFYQQEFQPKHLAKPTLVIHSLADKEVFIAQSRRFFRQLPSTKHFVQLKRANHDLTTGNETGRIVTEIDAWLQSLPPSRS